MEEYINYISWYASNKGADLKDNSDSTYLEMYSYDYDNNLDLYYATNNPYLTTEETVFIFPHSFLKPNKLRVYGKFQNFYAISEKLFIHRGYDFDFPETYDNDLYIYTIDNVSVSGGFFEGYFNQDFYTKKYKNLSILYNSGIQQFARFLPHLYDTRIYFYGANPAQMPKLFELNFYYIKDSGNNLINTSIGSGVYNFHAISGGLLFGSEQLAISNNFTTGQLLGLSGYTITQSTPSNPDNSTAFHFNFNFNPSGNYNVGRVKFKMDITSSDKKGIITTMFNSGNQLIGFNDGFAIPTSGDYSIELSMIDSNVEKKIYNVQELRDSKIVVFGLEDIIFKNIRLEFEDQIASYTDFTLGADNIKFENTNMYIDGRVVNAISGMGYLCTFGKTTYNNAVPLYTQTGEIITSSSDLFINGAFVDSNTVNMISAGIDDNFNAVTLQIDSYNKVNNNIEFTIKVADVLDNAVEFYTANIGVLDNFVNLATLGNENIDDSVDLYTYGVYEETSQVNFYTPSHILGSKNDSVGFFTHSGSNFLYAETPFYSPASLDPASVINLFMSVSTEDLDSEINLIILSETFYESNFDMSITNERIQISRFIGFCSYNVDKEEDNINFMIQRDEGILDIFNIYLQCNKEEENIALSVSGANVITNNVEMYTSAVDRATSSVLIHSHGF